MTPERTQPIWIFKRLPYGGVCVACDGQIEKNENGWHSPRASKVMCANCRPPDEISESLPPVAHPRSSLNPVGGTSALREYERQKGTNWRKGATGEYLMDRFLHRTLSDDEAILTDRRIPGTGANVDNVVVASSGVWIIDSKKWSGKIEYKATSFAGVDLRLFVGGEDRTDEIEKIYRLVIPIAQIIEDRSVPIHPALAFVEGDWKFSVVFRDLLKKPYKYEGVWISPPKLLGKMITAPGPLDQAAVLRVGQLLDERLKPR